MREAHNTQGSDLDGPAGKGWDEWDHPVACLRIVRFASASMDQVSTWSTIVVLSVLRKPREFRRIPSNSEEVLRGFTRFYLGPKNPEKLLRN